jgi:hypothetical protein
MYRLLKNHAADINIKRFLDKIGKQRHQLPLRTILIDSGAGILNVGGK